MNNFEHDDDIGGSNSYLLSSHGCFQRHNIKRKDMYLNDKENKLRNWELNNRSEREEKQLVIKAHSLFNKGYKLRPDESIETFIERCEEE